jgi:hypothetical protein
MKASKKRRRRFVRALAIAGAVTALAVPAGAGAMPIGPHNPAPMNYTQVSDQGTDGGAGMQQFGPGELTGGAPDGARLDHRGLHYTAAATQPSTTIRQIRTVVHEDSRTLEIALAASALGVALCGVGYATIRVTQSQRRVRVSN